MRTSIVVLVLCCAAGVVAAPAVGADAAQPTNFESVLDTVEPADAPVELSVVGGDSFLQVRAPSGVAVEVPGYDGEPYLRITTEGVVERNRRSPAVYLNENRDGSTDGLPEDASSSAPPDWERIGDGGVVAWHDHRIHWMLDDAPDTPEDRVVQVWTAELVVDGEEVTATGRLLHREDLAPWPLLVSVAAAAAAWWFGRRALPRQVITIAAAAVATVGSLNWYLANPMGADPSWMPIALAAGALVVAGALAIADRSGRTGPAGALVPVALLAGWLVERIGVFWMPTLPGSFPAPLDRVGTAAVAGVVVGLAAAVVSTPVAQDSSSRSSGSQSVAPPRS